MAGFERIRSCEGKFGGVDLYERFLVAIPNRDAGIRSSLAAFVEWVGSIAEEQYSKPWGYIGNRINGNASDPSLLAKGRRSGSLCQSFAVVGYSARTREFFELERLVLKGFPHGYFEELEAAMQWTDEVIRKIRGE